MPDSDPSALQRPAVRTTTPSLSAFTEAQRKALISEIVQEMRKDSLKDDVSSELKKAGRLKRVSNFFQHQAVLLVLGFAITGLIGGWLANHWQIKEWNRQQGKLLASENIKLKFELIDDIARSVGERNAATDGITTALLLDMSDQQLTEPYKNWQKAGYDWEVKSLILQVRIRNIISDKSADEIFTGIVEREKHIGSIVEVVKSDLAKYRKDRDGFDAQINETFKYRKGIREALEKLITVIVVEAETMRKSDQT